MRRSNTYVLALPVIPILNQAEAILNTQINIWSSTSLCAWPVQISSRAECHTGLLPYQPGITSITTTSPHSANIPGSFDIALHRFRTVSQPRELADRSVLPSRSVYIPCPSRQEYHDFHQRIPSSTTKTRTIIDHTARANSIDSSTRPTFQFHLAVAQASAPITASTTVSTQSSDTNKIHIQPSPPSLSPYPVTSEAATTLPPLAYFRTTRLDLEEAQRKGHHHFPSCPLQRHRHRNNVTILFPHGYFDRFEALRRYPCFSGFAHCRPRFREWRRADSDRYEGCGADGLDAGGEA